MTPSPFHAVGIWYDDFRPVSDDEVRRLLAATQSSTVGSGVAT
jgi:predicted phosphoribosyltransferase